MRTASGFPFWCPEKKNNLEKSGVRFRGTFLKYVICGTMALGGNNETFSVMSQTNWYFFCQRDQFLIVRRQSNCRDKTILCVKKEVLRGIIPFRRVTLTSQHYRERWWFYSLLCPCLNCSFGSSDTSLSEEKSAKQNSKPNRGQFSNCRSVGSLPKNRVGAQTESNPQLPATLNGRRRRKKTCGDY